MRAPLHKHHGGSVLNPETSPQPITSHKSQFTIYLTIGWLLVALIIYGSLSPAPITQDAGIGDKWQHFLAYFITMTWFAQLYGNSRKLLAQGIFLIALAIALEFAQKAGGDRTFETLDMLTSTAGVLTASLMPKYILTRILSTKPHDGP